MYSFIKGPLWTLKPSYAVIDSQGVGYKIFIPSSTYAKLIDPVNEVILHVSFVVREQSQALYGFYLEEERDLFEELLNVTGIGPKTAISIISHLSFADLQSAIASHDISSISKVPGIGKKTAERLIIEMRDKTLMKVSDSEKKLDNSNNEQIKDAMSALIHLGYSQSVAEKSIKNILKDNKNLDLSELIALTLKKM